MNRRTVGFSYDKSTRRLKRLQNNVLVLYTAEKVQLLSEEVKKINMKLRLRLPSDLVGCYTLLQTFSCSRITLLNSQHISSELNTASLNQP